MQTDLQRPERLFTNPVRYKIPAFQRRYKEDVEEMRRPDIAKFPERRKVMNVGS